MATKSKKAEVKKGGKSGKVGVALGVATVAAAATGAYLLFGSKDGAKRRKSIEDMASKVKDEVLKKVTELEDFSEKTYHEMVESVMEKYKGIKNIDTKEFAKITADLKKHWKSIQKQIKKGGSE